MNGNLERGHYAESLVAEMLRKRGFIISKMNYHSRFGEIDIIAETRKTIHFIEVKMRKADTLVSGAAAVDAAKQRKIIFTAADYIAKSHTEYLQPSFDVAELTEAVNEKGERIYKVNYYPDAFGSEI